MRPQDSDSEEELEPLSQRAARKCAPAGALPKVVSDNSSDDEDDNGGALLDGTETDDEQEEKEMEAVRWPFAQRRADPRELQALVMQDLKTEDPGQPGGYARRRIEAGSVVLVRGEDDEQGRPDTWVALVKKLHERRGRYYADIVWFYRKADVPKDATGKTIVGADPRTLLYTNDPHTVDARFIRHPAHAWFLNLADPPPAMRCGQGQQRHTRRRPGFLVQAVLDVPSNRVLPIGGPALAKANPELAAEVDRLVQRSAAELARLQEEEAAYDEAQGLRGVDAAPLGGRGADAAAPPGLESARPSSSSSSSEEEEPSSSESESEDSGSELEEEGTPAAAAAAAARATPEERQRQRRQRQQQRALDAEQRAAAKQAAKQARQVAAAEARQRQLQADADTHAATLARTLPQQSASSSGGGGGAPPPAAAATWQQAATQLRRLAAEGQGNELVWLEAGAAALTPAQVNVQARQAVLPSPKPMAAVLRAICGATEAAARELLGGRVPFFRVLLAWLWHMALFQKLDQLDCLGLPVEPGVAECAELALRALARTPYTGPMHNWLQAVLGFRLISQLAGPRGSYPAEVRQAASDLKAVWKAALEAQQQKRRERQQQAGGQRQGGAAAAAAASVQQQREDQKLLLQSPQAKAGLGLAVGGRRVSALGTSGATYVRPKGSPLPSGLRPPPAVSHVPKMSLAATAAGSSPLPQQQRQQQRQQHPQQQQQQQQQHVAVPAAKPAAQPGVPPAQKQQQQQQRQPAARAGSDSLAARWADAFKDSKPHGQQQRPNPLNRSATMPQATAAAAREQAAEAEAGLPRMQRSFSEPERRARQDARQAPVKQEPQELQPVKREQQQQKQQQPVKQEEQQRPVKQEQQQKPQHAAAAAAGQKRPAPGDDGGRTAKQPRHEAAAPKKPSLGRQGSKISALLKKGKRDHAY